MFLHVVGHGEVPVGRVPLREKDGVVEADGLVAGDPLQVVLHVVELLRMPHLRPDAAEDHRGDHDGARVQHGVVGLIWKIRYKYDAIVQSEECSEYLARGVKSYALYQLGNCYYVTFGIEADLIEVPPARLVADVAMNYLWTKLVQADGVGEGLAKWTKIESPSQLAQRRLNSNVKK